MLDAWLFALGIVMFGVLILTQSWIAVFVACMLAVLYGKRIRQTLRGARR